MFGSYHDFLAHIAKNAWQPLDIYPVFFQRTPNICKASFQSYSKEGLVAIKKYSCFIFEYA
jgi:hypothetical protein